MISNFGAASKVIFIQWWPCITSHCYYLPYRRFDTFVIDDRPEIVKSELFPADCTLKYIPEFGS